MTDVKICTHRHTGVCRSWWWLLLVWESSITFLVDGQLGDVLIVRIITCCLLVRSSQHYCTLRSQDGGLSLRVPVCTTPRELSDVRRPVSVNITAFCNVTPDNLIVSDVSESRAISVFMVALWWARCNQFTYSRVLHSCLVPSKNETAQQRGIFTLQSPVVTICTVQWSLYVPPV